MWKIVAIVAALAVVAFADEPIAISCKLVPDFSDAEDCKCAEYGSTLKNGEPVNNLIQVCDHGNYFKELSEHIVEYKTAKRTSTKVCYYLQEVEQYSCYDTSIHLFYNHTRADIRIMKKRHYGEKLINYLFDK